MYIAAKAWKYKTILTELVPHGMVHNSLRDVQGLTDLSVLLLLYTGAGNTWGFGYLPIWIHYCSPFYILFSCEESWRKAKNLRRSILRGKVSSFSSCLISPWALPRLKSWTSGDFFLAHLPPGTFSSCKRNRRFFNVNKNNLCRS